MFQFSTYISVFNRQYDGGISIAELRKKGDFGLGTFDSLEGELVAYNGDFYHCTNGVCTPAKDTQQLAWAALCFFNPEVKEALSAVTYEDFKENKVKTYHFEKELVALKIEGLFDFIEITSTPKQSKPYPAIQAVIDQSENFTLHTVNAQLIGWFAPTFMGEIKNPGFHFHCVEKEGNRGGHVLDFKLNSGQVEVEKMPKFEIQFGAVLDNTGKCYKGTYEKESNKQS